ncbi:MAG: hypothetical protein Kow001_07300 [Acidobacteriota bacterium]
MADGSLCGEHPPRAAGSGECSREGPVGGGGPPAPEPCPLPEGAGSQMNPGEYPLRLGFGFDATRINPDFIEL